MRVEKPPSFAQLSKTRDWDQNNLTAAARAFLVLTLVALRERRVLRIDVPPMGTTTTNGCTDWTSSAPLAVDASALESLRRSSDSIIASFPLSMRVTVRRSASIAPRRLARRHHKQKEERA